MSEFVPAADAAPRIPRDIWVLISAAFLVALGYGLITPVLPQLAKSFGVSDAAATVIVSSFAMLRLAFAPLGGRLVHTIGERTTYIAGLLIVAASALATGFAGSYGLMLVVRSLGGIGSVMFTVSTMALIVRLAPPQIRGRVASAYGGSFLVGSIAGPLVGGALAGFGMRVPFVVYTIALVFASGLVAYFLRGESARRADPATAPPPMLLREALGLPAYRSLLFTALANGWANFGVRVALMPLFVVAVVSDKPWVVGVVLAVFAAGNALVLSWSGRLSDRIGRKPMLIAGLTTAGLATIGMGQFGQLWQVLLASAIAGAGSGAVGPAQQAAVADIVGQERSGGSVIATFQMFQDGGAIIGPVVAGMLADQWNYTVAFAVTATILLLASASWLPARDTLPR